ncbi:hypothetical protein HOY82DRAFT_546519, partial [Tuber indicum]
SWCLCLFLLLPWLVDYLSVSYHITHHNRIMTNRSLSSVTKAQNHRKASPSPENTATSITTIATAPTTTVTRSSHPLGQKSTSHKTHFCRLPLSLCSHKYRMIFASTNYSYPHHCDSPSTRVLVQYSPWS